MKIHKQASKSETFPQWNPRVKRRLINQPIRQNEEKINERQKEIKRVPQIPMHQQLFSQYTNQANKGKIISNR